tara:strand:- start:159 stop:1064 length:906 start_codon:yes stop_codon:yes gene_type:complete
MKTCKFLAFSLFVLFHTLAFAQIAIPEKGTIWVYDYSNVSACGPIKAVYDRDTVLAGKSAMVFNETFYNICTHTNDNKPIDTLNWGSNIIAIEDSLVWYWQDEKFDTLMDFGASVGDKWTYSNSVDSMLCEVEGVIADANLGVGICVVYGWSIDNEPQTYMDTIYEALLGGDGYIIPNDIYQSFLDGQEGGPLMCYSNSKGRYSERTWTAGGAACTDIIEKLSVGEITKLKMFSIYPNPSSGNLRIVGNIQPLKMEVFTTEGQQVYSSKKPFEIDNLSPQIYFVKLWRNDGGVEVHRVVVE